MTSTNFYPEKSRLPDRTFTRGWLLSWFLSERKFKTTLIQGDPAVPGEVMQQMNRKQPMTKRLPPRGDHQPDLFAANFADIPIRDQRDTMERPFFSLAKKPRFAPIEYNVGDVWVEVSANPKFGLATIWDADILIWASTQITEAKDRGLTPTRTIHFHPRNLLKSIRRPTGGEHYQLAALEGSGRFCEVAFDVIGQQHHS
jgi:hypothetical protein